MNLEQTENILPENNNKKKNIVIGVIIGLLVIILVIGSYFYFMKNKTQNIYYQAIDTLAEAITKELNNSKKNQAITGSLIFNGTSKDADAKEVFNILNKTKLNLDMEMDYNNKKGNLIYDLLYDNKTIVKASMLLNDKETYLNLANLYNKDIRLTEMLSEIDLWSASNYNDYQIVIDEITKVLKKSLKEKYFSKENMTLKINGKNEQVVKHTLKLTEQDLKDISKDFINGIKDNDKLIEALSNISDSSKSSIISSLNEVDYNDISLNGEIISEIYLNKKDELVKFVYKDETDKLIIEQSGDDKYIIKLNDTEIGSITTSENKINMTIKDDKENIEVNIDIYSNEKDKIAEINIGIKYDQDVIEVQLTSNNNKGNMEFKIKSIKEDLDLTIKLDFEAKEIKEVKVREVNDYINVSEMTEEDFNKIGENLINNSELFNSLLQSM